MPKHTDHKITQSWTTNADAWTRAVRSGSIESRERTTNAAIVDAVLDCHPDTRQPLSLILAASPLS